jgi:uncharacterized protein YbjQ (UPF0145 family)
MILLTIESVPGRQIVEHYGVVFGSAVRSKHFGKDFFAGFKNILGGELKAYSALLDETRAEALKRLEAQAREKNADAIIGLRFGTSDVAAGAAEIFAYGTAVKLA